MKQRFGNDYRTAASGDINNLTHAAYFALHFLRRRKPGDQVCKTHKILCSEPTTPGGNDLELILRFCVRPSNRHVH